MPEEVVAQLTIVPFVSNEEVMRYLRHRRGKLLIDAGLNIVPGVSGYAVKNFTASDASADGHFDDYIVMAASDVEEAMRQAAGLVLRMGMADDDLKGRVPVFARSGEFKMLEPVRPGERLVIRVEGCKFRLRAKAFAFAKAVAYVESCYGYRHGGNEHGTTYSKKPATNEVELAFGFLTPSVQASNGEAVEIVDGPSWQHGIDDEGTITVRSTLPVEEA